MTTLTKLVQHIKLLGFFNLYFKVFLNFTNIFFIPFSLFQKRQITKNYMLKKRQHIYNCLSIISQKKILLLDYFIKNIRLKMFLLVFLH